MKTEKLTHAINNNENILVAGAVRSGKTLLLKSMQKLDQIQNRQTIQMNDDPIGFFQIVREKIERADSHLQIIIDEHLAVALFLEKDSARYFPIFTELVEKHQQNPLVRFCISVTNGIDRERQKKLDELFPNQFITALDDSKIDQNLAHKTFTVKEILAI